MPMSYFDAIWKSLAAFKRAFSLCSYLKHSLQMLRFINLLVCKHFNFNFVYRHCWHLATVFTNVTRAGAMLVGLNKFQRKYHKNVFFPFRQISNVSVIKEFWIYLNIFLRLCETQNEILRVKQKSEKVFRHVINFADYPEFPWKFSRFHWFILDFSLGSKYCNAESH